jgi:hypothetical protein
MTFDADGDGKLDKAELTKFAEDMIRMRAQLQGAAGRMQGRGFGPPGSGPGGPGGEGFRPRDGGGRPGGGGPPGGPEGGERPERPRRPE